MKEGGAWSTGASGSFLGNHSFVEGVVAASTLAAQAGELVEKARTLLLTANHIQKHHAWVGTTAATEPRLPA